MIHPPKMTELRWLQGNGGMSLQYRSRILACDASGALVPTDKWTPWEGIPGVSLEDVDNEELDELDAAPDPPAPAAAPAPEPEQPSLITLVQYGDDEWHATHDSNRSRKGVSGCDSWEEALGLLIGTNQKRFNLRIHIVYKDGTRDERE